MKLKASHVIFLVIGLVVGYGLGAFLNQAQETGPAAAPARPVDGSDSSRYLTGSAAKPAEAGQEPMAATAPPDVVAKAPTPQDTAGAQAAQQAEAAPAPLPGQPTQPPAVPPKAPETEEESEPPGAKSAPKPVQAPRPPKLPVPAPPQPPGPKPAKAETGPPSKARIWVETTSYETGIIPNDAKTVREIKVANKGVDPLVIKSVKSTCGCVAAKVKQMRLEPNAETALVLTIDPKRIHGFKSKRTVTLYSNDPENERVSIDVHVEIEREFELAPESIDFGTVEKGSTAEASQIFRQIGDAPIEVREVKTWQPVQGVAFSFEEIPADQWLKPDHREYRIKAKLLPEVPPGPFSARFSIVSTCKRYPNATSYAKANVAAFYSVKPNSVVLYSTQQDNRRRTARVVVSADRLFEIEDLSISNDAISVSTAPGDRPNTTVIELAAAPSDKPGTTNEKLSFSVKADGKVYRDEVNVKLLVRRAMPLKPRPTPPKAVPSGIQSSQKP